MRLRNVEVCGINEIVFMGKVCWKRHDSEEGRILWVSDRGDKTSHSDMMKLVKMCNINRHLQMWTHGDTLNVKRKGSRNGDGK